MCLFNIFLLITITNKQVFLESAFNFYITCLSITALLGIYSMRKINERRSTDKKVDKEWNTTHNKFFQKVYYLVITIPWIIPIVYYKKNFLSLDFLFYFVCFIPWLNSTLSFTCFTTWYIMLLKLLMTRN